MRFAVNLTKNDSVLVKGFAIVLVMTGHFIPQFFPYADIYVPIKRIISQIGVEIFLLISGYGVMSSYFLVNGEPWRFIYKRVVSLWPLYAVALSVYYVISIAVFNEHISLISLLAHFFWAQVFFNLSNDIYSASHFFSVLLVVYLLSAFSLSVKENNRKALVFIICTMTFNIACYFYFGEFLFPDYLASFSAGLFLASYTEEKKSFYYKYIYCIPIIFCISESYSLQKFILGCVVYFLIQFIIKKMKSDRVLMKTLFWFGTNSYVLYLGHNYFLWKWPQILEKTGGILQTGLVIIISTVLWIILLLKIDNHLNRGVYAPLIRKLN